MIIPVRCFSCGRVIGDKWEPFSRRVAGGEPPGDVLDDLDLTRYCCRRMLMSHVEIIDEILRFYEEKENVELVGGN
ncbi:DNA-directed RNA polymerase subunit N [miscellaneous Crenarchaeota group-15 archaeon DG-45]|uniref:DNA-directed RNA polymerase subunit Rpo10 n=1 Tax=miscellaneous Crenarchaeota group-15 archaeon DG-45 TaxID=1685127 RepID=A0A0M0BPX9_9ARCH|nr:MAG: DNA-directed RNA polymerase subunit N [miscellaneous Crenarchaeota group-15 archaeon DG-45]